MGRKNPRKFLIYFSDEDLKKIEKIQEKVLEKYPERKNINRSEIIRKSVDMYYKNIFAENHDNENINLEKSELSAQVVLCLKQLSNVLDEFKDELK